MDRTVAARPFVIAGKYFLYPLQTAGPQGATYGSGRDRKVAVESSRHIYLQLPGGSASPRMRAGAICQRWSAWFCGGAV